MVRNARRKLLALTGARKDFDWDAHVVAITSLLQYVWGVALPDRDLHETNPTCGRGSRAHRPSRTPSGTDDSGRDSGLAPGNIEPTQRASTKEKGATVL